MRPAITRTLRNRWLAAGVHAALWVLLYLAVTHLGGKAFYFREAEATATTTQSPVPVARLEQLFAPGVSPLALVQSNSLDPFVTRHFIPAQLPPPTTRKIELTYQGFYQAGDGPIHAVLKLSEAFVTTPVGGKVANGLFVAEATMQALTLTNLAAQTNLVPLNVKKEIVVPIQ